jgi:hypothetical protein
VPRCSVPRPFGTEDQGASDANTITVCLCSDFGAVCFRPQINVAWAWGNEGHQIVARIAAANLDDAAILKAAAILCKDTDSQIKTEYNPQLRRYGYSRGFANAMAIVATGQTICPAVKDRLKVGTSSHRAVRKGGQHDEPFDRTSARPRQRFQSASSRLTDPTISATTRLLLCGSNSLRQGSAGFGT